MKLRVFIVFILCILLAGCASYQDQAEQPAASEIPQATAERAAQTAAETAVRILPLPDTTMDALNDSIVNVSVARDGFCRDESGNILLTMQVYSYDRYDMVDISAMNAGDTILFCGEEILVNAVDRDSSGTVHVNGGLDEGGFDLATDDSGIYFALGYNDMKSWIPVGEAVCPVSDSFVFTDSADLDLGAVTYTAGDLLAGMPVPEYGYQPQNTTVRIENGQVVTMDRVYTP